MTDERREQLNGVGLLLLRLAAGGFMLSHGYPKLMGYEKVVAGFVEKGRDFMPLVGPSTEVALVVLAEFFCSIALILGLFTRLAAVPLVIAMLVAAFMAHASDPFSGKEKALLYLAMYASLVFTGPGPYSLDAWVQPRMPWGKKD